MAEQENTIEPSVITEARAFINKLPSAAFLGMEIESPSPIPVELKPPRYADYLYSVAADVPVILALVGAMAGAAAGFFLTGEVDTHEWRKLVIGVGVKLTGMGIGAVSGAMLGAGVGFVLSDIVSDLIRRFHYRK